MKIKISPKDLMSQGIVISGFITNNTHTMLQISGVSLLDISRLVQVGLVDNKYIANNACIINLVKNNFDILD